MKKILLGLFLLMALALSYGWWERAHFVSKILSNATGMPIAVTDLSLFPLTLRGVHIVDEKTKTDVTFGAVVLHAPLASLFSDPIAIDKLTLKNTVVKSQFDPLQMLKLGTFLGESPPPSAKSRTLKIDAIDLENLFLEVPNPIGKKGETIRVKIPAFSLNNLNEITLEGLLKQIVQQAKKK